MNLSNLNQWKSETQNKTYLKESKSNQSLLNSLNNTYHLHSYFKNGVSKDTNVKAKSHHMENGLSLLKRKVLDLKCKLSGLQKQRERKAELESRLEQLEKDKDAEERVTRKELDELMRGVSVLKGSVEEQKSQLQRLELKREIKTQDLNKIQELVEAKGEELEDLQERRAEASCKMNQELAQKDSLDKELYLLKEEGHRLELEAAGLDRQLREVCNRHKVALDQTERIQVYWPNTFYF
jgi:chromosome segregation ATPase